jgi:hypothetical protein
VKRIFCSTLPHFFSQSVDNFAQIYASQVIDNDAMASANGKIFCPTSTTVVSARRTLKVRDARKSRTVAMGTV